MKKQKNIELPFYISSLLAFYKVLLYEDKRKLSINTLAIYRDLLLNNMIEAKSTNKNPNVYNHINIVLTNIDELEEAKDFVERFQEYFYLDDKDIVIKDHVSAIDLNKLSTQENENFYECYPSFISSADQLDDQMRNLFSINTVLNDLKNKLKYEIELAKYYELLVQNPNNEEIKSRIKELLSKRLTYFESIVRKGYSALESYSLESINLKIENDNSSNNYPPIDFKEWQNSSFYQKYKKDLYIEFDDIEGNFYDSYQQTTFNNCQLSGLKLFEELMSLRIAYNFQPGGTPNSVQTTEQIAIETIEVISNYELLFWMSYINKIDELIEKYGHNEDLLNTKARLLYMLDSIHFSLYDKAKFDTKLAELNNLVEDIEITDEDEIEDENEDYDIGYIRNNIDPIIPQEDYQDISIQALYFIVDVFECQNSKDLLFKKLIFISTYYSLTKDIHIVKTLDKYQEYPMYEEYREIIIGQTFTLKLIK